MEIRRAIEIANKPTAYSIPELREAECVLSELLDNVVEEILYGEEP